MTRTALAIAAALALPTAAGAAPKPPPWTALADCAGAYMANSRVADPDRPASMVSQMSDTADDYAKAARTAYRRRLKAGAGAARKLVAARIEATAHRLARQPREAAETMIDACPQPDA